MSLDAMEKVPDVVYEASDVYKGGGLFVCPGRQFVLELFW